MLHGHVVHSANGRRARTLVHRYGAATMSRLLKIIGLFCKTDLQKRLYSAKQTCKYKEPTSRIHPIAGCNTWAFCVRVVISLAQWVCACAWICSYEYVVERWGAGVETHFQEIS